MLHAQPAHALGTATDICLDKTLLTATAGNADGIGQSRLEMMRAQQEARLAPAPAATELPSTASPYTGALCVTDMTAARLDAPDPNKMPIEQPLPASDRPDVFGSIALPVSYTPLDLKWRSASQSRFAKRSGPWGALLRSVSGQGRSAQIQAINEWVNARVRFTDDRKDKLGADRWSSASDTLRRQRGDCEDYAIAKMKLLEAAGVDRNDMYLVVVEDLVRRADHALLVVRLGQQMVVLDNSTDQMLDARHVADYRPIFSYSAAGAWIHGYAETPGIIPIV